MQRIQVKKLYKKQKLNKKNTRGITLIALVVTIAVLLILARSNNNNGTRWRWNIKYVKGSSR